MQTKTETRAGARPGRPGKPGQIGQIGKRAAAAARDCGKVTLEMVAAAVGVSASTVSRILNGTVLVSDENRSAVAEAIARPGFVPNPLARGLAGGHRLSVGVVTQAIDSPFMVARCAALKTSSGNADQVPGGALPRICRAPVDNP